MKKNKQKKQGKKVSSLRVVSFFWKQMKGYRMLFIFDCLMVSAASALGIVIVAMLGSFVDLMTKSIPGDNSIASGWSLLFTMIALMLIAYALWKISNFVIAFIEAKVLAKIDNNNFQYLIRHSYEYFSNNFAGALVKKMGRMAGAFENLMDMFVYETLNSFVVILAILVSVFLFNFWLGIGVFVMVFSSVIVHIFLANIKYQKYDLPTAKMDSEVGGAIADIVSNSNTVKMFGAEKHEDMRFFDMVLAWRKQLLKAWNFSATIDAIIDGILQFFRIALLVVSFVLWTRNQLSAASFVVIQFYLFRIWEILFFFGRLLRRYFRGVADADEMLEVLECEHSVKDKPNAKNIKIRKGVVEFVNVDFSYLSKSKRSSVIQNVNLKIKSGEKVALVGPSGGGKSTLIKLIMRFYDLQKGKIFIDGYNIANVKQSSLRSAIAMVPQEPILFHRSLMDNIRYGRFDASDEEVIAASKMAYCHEFIMRFEKGYDTYVGERGVKLSGGQRQRVAIARAILSNARLLILDEATSSLDSQSEKYIQNALNNLIKNKTVIIIAHRLSTIMSSDRIVVLKNGEIVEEGNHASLRNSNGSLYGKLWNTQVGEFSEASESKISD